MADKKYVGNGKVVGKFDHIAIGVKYSDLVPNEKGWCNLIVAKRREMDKYGNTHTVYINDWTPQSGRGQQSEERREQERQNFQPNDPFPEEPSPSDRDLPF